MAKKILKFIRDTIKNTLVVEGGIAIKNKKKYVLKIWIVFESLSYTLVTMFFPSIKQQIMKDQMEFMKILDLNANL